MPKQRRAVASRASARATSSRAPVKKSKVKAKPGARSAGGRRPDVRRPDVATRTLPTGQTTAVKEAPRRLPAPEAPPPPPRKPAFYEALAVYESGVRALQRHDFAAAPRGSGA